MSRAVFAAGALLASVSLAQAESRATFSPELKDASEGLKPAAPPAAAPPPPAAVAEAPPAARGKAAKRRTRLARAKASPREAGHEKAGREEVAALKPTVPEPPQAPPAPQTAASVPPPATPEERRVAEAQATYEAPAPAAEKTAGGNREEASRTPGPPPAEPAGGPREAASGTVAELLARHAEANGVPLKLAQAVVQIESRGNARASNHGALGLMQIKYGTARAAGFGGAAMGLFVADTNLRYGMKILGQAYKAAGGDTCGALMRYQSGHLSTHMNAANRAYCSRARAIMARA